MATDTYSDSEACVQRACSVVKSVAPLLAGHPPDVQGAALVELVALHLAGHPPQMRAHLLALHCGCVRRMVPVVEAELFGADGHPAHDG